jgi:hypothetical protein
MKECGRRSDERLARRVGNENALCVSGLWCFEQILFGWYSRITADDRVVESSCETNENGRISGLASRISPTRTGDQDGLFWPITRRFALFHPTKAT